MAPQSEIDVFGLVVGLFQENTFFLRRRDAAETVIIDPGDEGERTSGLIRSHGWKPVAVVNTHAHLDHMGAVARLKSEFGIPFYLHPDDEPLLRAAPEHAAAFGMPAPEVPVVDRPLGHRRTLDLAGLAIQVIHTPGGVSLAVPGRVFAGDTLFLGSIGRTDLPGGDYGTLIDSIRDRLMALPDETIVHCGHGPDTTIGRERKTNPFLRAPGNALP
ncbi:MAG: MBL fold metallo-hydrolase [Candidatus Eisenbacteria bacterium]